jgi:hypothetical protein
MHARRGSPPLALVFEAYLDTGAERAEFAGLTELEQSVLGVLGVLSGAP